MIETTDSIVTMFYCLSFLSFNVINKIIQRKKFVLNTLL